jgi:HAD superfamily hydrolase (TIGR01549 family)
MRTLIFDLDGTLIDTVYAHVFAWQRALAESGMQIEGWRIHRKIGMSGGLFTRAVARELNRELSQQEIEWLQKRHNELFDQLMPDRIPLRGAVELLKFLSSEKITYGIATSGRRPHINPSLKALGVPDDVIVIDRGDVQRAKPEPDLFLACQKRMNVKAEDCYIIGDAVWDLLAARRANMLSIGLLSGGYGEDELSRAGAYRVYADPFELLHSLDEIGVLP